MCKLLVHSLPSTSGKGQVENVDGRGFASHNEVNHQDINYNCLYLLYYTYNKHWNQ